ncbi:anthrone oxygenase family protein [Brevibacterium daeguense]|uniref:anthrone oxygenase family protein n=1 Tax=Brevibacterium daeguense TaxID=909936 RepID=UPI001F34EA96
MVAIVTNGLLAGLFFAFTCAVTVGFRDVDDRTYIQAFRAINTAILNRRFLLAFFAAPLTAVVSAVLLPWRGNPTPLLWLGLGAICSALTFLITAAVNVPLNRALDRATVSSEAHVRDARQQFEPRWNRWHHTRTLTSTAALVSFALAVVLERG